MVARDAGRTVLPFDPRVLDWGATANFPAKRADMDTIRRFTLLGFVCLVVGSASCSQDRGDPMVAMADRLISNSDELLKLLQSIKDPASATASIPELPEAYNRVFPLIRKLVERGTAADRRGEVTLDAQHALERRVAEFQAVSKRIEAETKRIQEIRGLPAEFWDVLRAEAMKSVSLVIEAMPSNFPPENLSYLRSVSQMMVDYGPQKVVLIELEGVSPGPIQEFCRQIQSKVGPNASIAHLTTIGTTSVMVGPVDDFDALLASIDFGKVVDTDPAQRLIRVEPVGMLRPRSTDVTDERPRLGIPSGERFRRPDLDSRQDRPERAKLDDIPGHIRAEEMQSSFRDLAGGRQALPSPSDPDYHKKLCDLLVDEQSWHLRDDAIDELLRVNPRDVKNKQVLQQIARNFRTLAMDDSHSPTAEKAIRGLVLYGGKYSVPLLIEIMDRERLRVPNEVFDGLAQLKDPRGADALTRQLGNFFNHEAASSALRKMGPVAEDALMIVAPSDDPAVSLAAVQLLGDVGTAKCLPLLRRASRSRNPQIVDAAGIAMRKIREREESDD